MPNDKPTIVVFRRWRPTREDPCDEVFALFPEEKGVLAYATSRGTTAATTLPGSAGRRTRETGSCTQTRWPASGSCVSYSHIGQHSSANYAHCIARSRPTTPEEYAPLLKELKQVGYDNLVIRKRYTRRG